MIEPSRSERESEDYRALLHGEITSEEYVRRLREHVRARPPIGGRYYPRHALRHPEQAARLGFWDGVRSIFRWR